MSTPPPLCPQCQAPIAPDAPGGLCPACVLRGVAQADSGPAAAPALAPSLEEVGAAFPELEMLELLGRGGMGVVFKARQPRLDRLVALKILPPELARQPGFAERFTREARALARLSHPHIVAVYDFGERAGFYYLLMEFVSGLNLRDAMRAGITPAQALLLVPRICDALQFAHDHGVLHRDIKPENILIDQSAEGSVAKISDFGLAKSFRGVGLSGLTFSGEMRGTIPFMPPEQMTDFKTVRPQADLYATAATLYFLLTAKYIYDEPEGGGDLIKMLLEDQPIPILDRRPDVPPGLAAVIGQCLSRDPEQRYPDATAMRKALKPFCNI